MMSKQNKTQQRGWWEAVARPAGRARRTVVWALRWHPWLAAAVLVVAWAAVVAGRRGLLQLAVVVAAVTGVWWQGHRDSFEAVVAGRVRASWRREWVYRRRWRKTMWLHSLAVRFDGTDVVPVLGRVRSSAVSDAVSVRIPEGQEPLDWSQRASSLAEAFGALSCRVTHPKLRRVQLDFMRRRDIPVVAPLPIADRPDLDALPIGRRGDGKVWCLRLASVVHVMICGVTKAGKGSVLWSIIRALAGGIRDGWVQIWAADPKGGMELGHGPLDDAGVPTCPLFARFATHAAQIADMLDDAVARLEARARRYAGVTRQHTPTRAEPTIVILVDELARVTRYASETERERIAQALSILLSEGRAVGIHLIVAVQDPRKTTVKVRDLIPARVGLRMVDADHVDAALGQTAWSRGARCEDIPASAPGCAWVFEDGGPDPIWVRASWISDHDIAHMAHHYAAPAPAAVNVVDLDDHRPSNDDEEPPEASAAEGGR